MKVAVQSLQRRPLVLAATESPAELGLAAEGAVFDAPVEVSAKLTGMNEDVLAQGQAATTVRLQCSRCLEDVEVPLAGHFEALYVPKNGPYAKRMDQPNFEWGDQRVNFYSEFTVDLSEEIANCLRIELPMKPLCRPDCAGLCQKCGANLNEGPCGCKPDEEDGPWAKLRGLIPPTPRGRPS